LFLPFIILVPHRIPGALIPLLVISCYRLTTGLPSVGGQVFDIREYGAHDGFDFEATSSSEIQITSQVEELSDGDLSSGL